ncbi:ATP-binding cassette domain-containing protein [Thiospirochaeta perfilievii]|uniref:ATP-binding cassette domain-containing protein n=1 Tax=Thiospirochaeta perfilievii TaxID=252967 RepID=A0A5C1Q915_9SPIO|nr:oligopeptide/dipeptide ABC transporter ATP-binding protein [Thiospirochaeta perfilievii]QEN03858.1 ATP-binding cassette domain-containing protein [Thiospirochaeta perfilievii]
MDDKVLMEVKNLKKYYEIPSTKIGGKSQYVKALDDISFTLQKGEILGIVGESGCGKSTLGKTILRLHEKTEGEVIYNNTDLFSLTKSELSSIRKDIQMVFQDPFSSLNPRKKVEALIGQPLKIHKEGNIIERSKKVESIMEEVGINPLYKKRFPHQFSGGQRQRIGIARALALNPELVVCDEAVSALDVSVQAQIINLLLDLWEKHKLTYIFIAHDLSVVEFISTRIIVMYLGRIVEIADKKELVERHVHPYSKALFEAFPLTNPHNRQDKKRVVIGDVPSPLNPPKGCHFHPRCPYAMERCKREYPPLKEISKGHSVACWIEN